MCFEASCIDHYGPFLAMRSRQRVHHLSEDAFVAPSFPTTIERHVRAVVSWRVTSS